MQKCHNPILFGFLFKQANSYSVQQGSFALLKNGSAELSKKNSILTVKYLLLWSEPSTLQTTILSVTTLNTETCFSCLSHTLILAVNKPSLQVETLQWVRINDKRRYCMWATNTLSVLIYSTNFKEISYRMCVYPMQFCIFSNRYLYHDDSRTWLRWGMYSTNPLQCVSISRGTRGPRSPNFQHI